MVIGKGPYELAALCPKCKTEIAQVRYPIPPDSNADRVMVNYWITCPNCRNRTFVQYPSYDQETDRAEGNPGQV
jgi:DNA-directed RNA polymerase subunit RPC12/RpoP